MGLHPTVLLSAAYPGPSDSDPLTDDELTLLLAIPRVADSTPNATLFRFPVGHIPSMGWIDVTCAEARSIIAHLAMVWRPRLTEILHQTEHSIPNRPVGPGTTICILVEPDFHSIFHLLAFWAIGCSVQFVSTADPNILDSQLTQSGCDLIIYSGFDDAWVIERKRRFDGPIIQLPEEEQAHRLAVSEKQREVGTSPAWPIPQRPSPALILQSTGTTGYPKLLRLSLYFHTIGHEYNCRMHLNCIFPDRTDKTPHSHPRLLLAPFYWQNFYRTLFIHLTTATPIAFAWFMNILEFSSSQLIDWAKTLDVGAIACDAGQVCQMPRTTLAEHAGFFRGLYSFTLSGAAIGSSLSKSLEELGIRITVCVSRRSQPPTISYKITFDQNIYGMSELGRLLICTKAPYTQLRPFPDMALPLVRPLTNFGSDGSRNVELWLRLANFAPLAHHQTHKGAPIKLEPFPGDGPHKGEYAFNLGDVFQELMVKSKSTSAHETVYIHAGRYSDQIRLSGTWVDDMNATSYETHLMSEINSGIGCANAHSWNVNAIQLFGTNMPCTALVVQIHNSTRISGKPYRGETPDEKFIQRLCESIEKVNHHLKLPPGQRIHVEKRTLIVDSDGRFVRGSGAERLVGLCASLSVTHKRSARRWASVCKFKPWLDGLDFSEP
ncbi:hypothetical protein RHS04_06441 [Rhizoctonia solani]|uniref:Uncharacterized protein n=1 Tax=Rhizoctonia solani TaxID=456999 RepID=A0A8H7H460_9AGAM|nr:hypothetical protein RHS04_06441 [Rhizoctonia solani]